MSRLWITCSVLLATLTATAAAREAPRFAQPPSDHVSAPRSIGELDPASAPQLEPVVDRAAVRIALRSQRRDNLARFRAYQRSGVFPSNTVGHGKVHVWRDPQGNLCAAATIIDASGLHDLVRAVGEQDNFLRLADVRQGPVMDWILMSGFTQAELVAIQEPFDMVSDEPMPEPMAQPVVAINLARRAAEDRRLRAVYQRVDAQLVRAERASLDRAVDRVMQHPQLAHQLVLAHRG